MPVWGIDRFSWVFAKKDACLACKQGAVQEGVVKTLNNLTFFNFY